MLKYFISFMFIILPTISFGQKENSKKGDGTNKTLYYTLDSFVSDLKREHFQIFTEREDIPKFITRRLKRLTHGFSIANPNEDWQCCCTSSKRLPERQISFSAKSEHILVLTYRTGGWGVMKHLLLIRYSKGKITELLTLHGLDEIDNIDSLTNYLTLGLQDSEKLQVDLYIW